jgi:hypothetical protein
MVVHGYNFSTQKPRQEDLKFEASMEYIARTHLKQTTKKTQGVLQLENG